jgi:hypothetical protein
MTLTTAQLSRVESRGAVPAFASPTFFFRFCSRCWRSSRPKNVWGQPLFAANRANNANNYKNIKEQQPVLAPQLPFTLKSSIDDKP